MSQIPSLEQRIISSTPTELMRLKDSISVSDANTQKKQKYIAMINSRLKPDISTCVIEHGENNESYDEFVSGTEV